MMASPRLAGRGSSLVEVLVAAAILGGVLLSGAALFAAGLRTTRASGHATQALAAARSMIERVHGLGLRQTSRVFGAVGCRPDVDGECRVDSRADPEARAWQSELERALGRARAEIRLEALGGASLDGARAIRLGVTVFWTEGPRERAVSVVAVRG
jgi:type II secretory pathway pseudopilin PulG